MFDIINSIQDEDLRFALLLMIVIFGFIVVLFSVISVTSMVAKLYRVRVDADLKRDMLDRGMTVEEIAVVMSAGGTAKQRRRVAEQMTMDYADQSAPETTATS